MATALQTVRDVQICSTGTYPLASGRTTFSEEDLADAVLASKDPTVPAPRLKLGHTDPRFDEAFASADFDGTPAFGTATNLRLSPDRQTILGDYENVPDWLAATMPSSYPSRSIEGAFGFTAASGRKYRLAIANVALLGTTWPGVTSLADLKDVLSKTGAAEDVAASDGSVNVAGGTAERFAIARAADREPVIAGIDLGVVQRQFVQDLDAGKVPAPAAAGLAPMGQWWAKSVRFDDGQHAIIASDGDGHLIRFPFTMTNDTLAYGTPELVAQTYTPIAASNLPTAVLASWETRAASRPSTTPEVATMQVDPAVLRKRLGLADDADDAAITEALTVAVPALAPSPVAASTEPVEKDKPASPAIPEGMVLLDAETLAALKAGAEKGTAVAARFASQERDEVIDAAISQRGRISASSRQTWATRWDADPDGTRTLLTADVAAGGLPDNTIPVAMREIGHSGDGEDVTASAGNAEAEDMAFMRQYNPQIYAKMQARQSGLRIRTEV
jgi:hypothetical protein